MHFVCLGSADYIGLNHYFSQEFTSGEIGPNPSYLRDAGVVGRYDPRWPATFDPVYKVSEQNINVGIYEHFLRCP